MSALGRLFYGLLFVLICAASILGAHFVATGLKLDEQLTADQVPSISAEPTSRCTDSGGQGSSIRIELPQRVSLR